MDDDETGDDEEVSDVAVRFWPVDDNGDALGPPVEAPGVAFVAVTVDVGDPAALGMSYRDGMVTVYAEPTEVLDLPVVEGSVAAGPYCRRR